MLMSREVVYHDGPLALKGVVWGECVGDNKPGIVVFPDAMGHGEHSMERAHALADMGYVALAADVYGECLQPRDVARALELSTALRADSTQWRSRARACLDALTTADGVDKQRLGAIGFCFGGSTALELARSGAPVKAAVCFHGGLETQLPARQGFVTSTILVCSGARDSRVPLTSVPVFLDEMEAAGCECEVVVYSGVQHSFTNRATDALPGMAYSARADRRSWATMRAFLEDRFRHSVGDSPRRNAD